VVQVRAMQILDGLEPTRRGPYGGGIGHVSFTGGMDMALALRTMVIPTGGSIDYLYDYHHQPKARREWTVHIQVHTACPGLRFTACLIQSSAHEPEMREAQYSSVQYQVNQVLTRICIAGGSRAGGGLGPLVRVRGNRHKGSCPGACH